VALARIFPHGEKPIGVITNYELRNGKTPAQEKEAGERMEEKRSGQKGGEVRRRETGI